MISFPFRLALKSALVQKQRFFSLALTITVASVLLIVLSTLYWNAESQLAFELRGVPNLVVEPEKAPAMQRAGLDFEFDEGWLFAALEDNRVADLLPATGAPRRGLA